MPSLGKKGYQLPKGLVNQRLDSVVSFPSRRGLAGI